MTRAELNAFVERDWAAAEAAKAADWSLRKRTMSPARLLATAEGLRRGVRKLRPDWPSDSDRAADLKTHVEIAEQLRRVRVRSAH